MEDIFNIHNFKSINIENYANWHYNYVVLLIK